MVLIKRKWSRRRFLAAAGVYGGATTLAAMLPHLGDAEAAGAAPKRLLLVNTGNGTIMNKWRPRTPGGQDLPSGSVLPPLTGPILGALERHRSKLVLIDGLDMRSAYNDDMSEANLSGNAAYGSAAGHNAASTLWTGRNGGGPYWSAPNGQGEFPDGPSVDQAIAAQIGQFTAFGSLQLGNYVPENRNSTIHAYDMLGNPLPPQYAPQVAFDTIFAGAETDDGALDRRKRRVSRSLDVLRGDIRRLREELPGEDRERLDAHLVHFDTLEQRLDASTTCTIGTGPADGLDVNGRFDAMQSIIQQTFACDRTRVINYTLSPEVNAFKNGQLSFLPGWNDQAYGDGHGLSHMSYYTQTAADVMTAYCAWQASKFADLLDLLDNIQEGFGETMLDNTVVVWGTALSHGGTHLSRATPAILATGKNGHFKTDKYLRFGNYNPDDLGRDASGKRYTDKFECMPNHHLLVSLCNAFGLNDVTSFGDARFTGPLTGLEFS